jgi:hypothetical protein
MRSTLGVSHARTASESLLVTSEGQLVIALSGRGGANDAIHGLMVEFGNALASKGLSVIHVTLEQAELQYAIEQMSRRQVRFGLTWLGIGQDLAVTDGRGKQLNMWDALRVPLVKIHADSPAYFSDRHRDLPKVSVNLYMAEEFAHFRRRWLRDAHSLSGVIPPWPMAPLELETVNLAKRRAGTLVFLKNGNSADALEDLWVERLTPSVGAMLRGMAEEILPVGLRQGMLHIGDFVADVLQARGLDPDSVLGLIPFFTAQLDDYLRRVKSSLIATSLLDFPIIVQGANWEHIDFLGRKARLVSGEDFQTSSRIFTEELGVVDMSPNIDRQPHDRVYRAAGSYSMVLTNRQSWLTESFSEYIDLTFAFDKQSIQEKIADVLSNRDRYLEMAVEFGKRFRAVYPAEAFADRVIEMADLAALQYAAERPGIQNFFIWPST